MKPVLLNPASIIAAAVMIIAAAGLGTIIRSLDIYLTKLPIEPESGLQFHSLPSDLPSWIQEGEDKVMSKEEADELGTLNYISRWYREKNPPAGQSPRRIELHCAYYTGMIDTVPHVPERCFVGGGWDISGKSIQAPVPLTFKASDGTDIITVDSDVDSELHGTIYSMRSPVSFNRVRLPRGIDQLRMNVTKFRDATDTVQMYAGYFFLANGGVVATADDVRLLAFKLNDDYAYYAKIQFLSASVKSHEELGLVAGSLLDELLPEIMRRVPDWIDVSEGLYPPDNPRAGKQMTAHSGRGGSAVPH